ncbi:MAG: hypothetical protein H5T97_05535, partial [Firmicutes bacterium]|nr:hypothetical protein [Bacillota bacterium]
RLARGPGKAPPATADLYRQAWELDLQSRARLEEHLGACRDVLAGLRSARRLLGNRNPDPTPGAFLDRRG